jgi:hypothetical protein
MAFISATRDKKNDILMKRVSCSVVCEAADCRNTITTDLHRLNDLRHNDSKYFTCSPGCRASLNAVYGPRSVSSSLAPQASRLQYFWQQILPLAALEGVRDYALG